MNLFFRFVSVFSCLRRGFSCNVKLIIPFVLNPTFLYRMETSENLRFSDVFRGRKKDVLGTNEVKNIWRYAAEGLRQDEWWITFLIYPYILVF